MKTEIIIAQLEAVKAGMIGEEFEAYSRALQILINTMKGDKEQ